MTTLFRHILLGTDLSAAQRHAYPWAALLAQRCDAKLTVLHVDEADRTHLAALEDFGAYLDLVDAQLQDDMQQVQMDLSRLGARCELATRAGTPKRTIDEYAAEHGVDLIVVGKHTLRDSPASPLGPNVTGLLHKSRLPVLVVPIFDDDDGGEDQSTIELPVIERVLTPTDLGAVSREGVLFAARLSKHLYNDVRLTVGHVLDWPGAGRFRLSPRGVEHLRTAANEHLEQLLLDLGDPQADSIETQVAVGSAVDALLQMADDTDADFIIMPSSGKGVFSRLLLGSTTDRLIKRATRPVLMLPPRFLIPSD